MFIMEVIELIFDMNITFLKFRILNMLMIKITRFNLIF